MNALTQLKRQLDRVTESNPNTQWNNPKLMPELIKTLIKRHGGFERAPEQSTMIDALNDYKKHRQPNGWRGLKYCCYGISIEIEKWRLLDDEILRERLFYLVNEQNPRRLSRCFQGLLSSYWHCSPKETGHDVLRSWLAKTLSTLQTQLKPLPNWLKILIEHKNLLTQQPCQRYAESLLAGDANEFSHVFSELAIPKNSWLMEEAILAPIIFTVNLNDEGFKQKLAPLLKLISRSETTLSPNELLKKRCVAILVSRYARCLAPTEHTLLRDSAVNIIGNPWIKRHEWDAHVIGQDGQPDYTAREMINGWLKRRLITDFFELMAEAGTGDRRRVDYWLKREPEITQMWFGLGKNAQENRDNRIREFRERAKDSYFKYAGDKASDNAFLMRIDNYLVIEFSNTGGACYVYDWNDLPFELEKVQRSSFIADNDTLKNAKKCICRLLHVGAWESRFDSRFSSKFVLNDIDELIKHLKRKRIKTEDLQGKGGCFWIRTEDKEKHLTTSLIKLGFQYKPDKGWWKIW